MSVCQGCGTTLPPSKGPVPRKWCSDRCRKQTLYGGTCVDCGATTNGSDGRKPEPRCGTCSARRVGHANKVWTRDGILAAIRAWADEYGEPPAQTDWNPHHARRILHDDARARRFEDANGRWPTFKTPIREFGSWNAAIVAAGFAPRPCHGGGENARRQRSVRERQAA